MSKVRPIPQSIQRGARDDRPRVKKAADIIIEQALLTRTLRYQIKDFARGTPACPARSLHLPANKFVGSPILYLWIVDYCKR
jgi:hypothetical protein